MIWAQPLTDSDITCKRHCRQVWKHYSIVSTWSSCLGSVGVFHQEVDKRHVDSAARPDIVNFDLGILANVELDISLAYLFNKELINTSARFGGHAASVLEEEKKPKYRPLGQDDLINLDI